jgi:uncharacterized cupredoxin-like copper-binding protein
MVLSVLSLILAACGGGASAPSTSLTVEMTDFHYSPDKWNVPAGQTITLDLVNGGAVVHEFVIMKFGTNVGDDFGPEDEANVYWQVEVQPGQSLTTAFVAPTEPGTYQVVCGTKGHYVSGMSGVLTVAAP